MTQMTYRRLGRSGLKVSVLSYGSWMMIEEPAKQDLFDQLVKIAYEAGVNFFDNSEHYSFGKSEEVFGNAIKNNKIKREDIVVSTKICIGTGGWGPNATGLSKKHVIEGLNASLKRLQLDYVDLVFATRPDPETPIEETVRAFNLLINQGKAFYWGTSMWSAQQITEAHAVAQRLGLEGPVMEQTEYNLFDREKIEKEFLPIFENFGLGTTVFRPLAHGILTGKYNDGIPEGSRFTMAHPAMQAMAKQFDTVEGKSKLEKVQKLTTIAERLGCTTAQLSIAWNAKNPNVSTVLTGASKVDQMESNLKALEIIEKLTPEVLEEIESIFQTKPTPVLSFRG
ncbi:voltage-dependent potassium channel, beta subunit [Conidiobolus coronatus NRRL 28638]|uniref:Voltage-dependent potassium channel, beta subunit n=1 Tax=Conidiobolus coronatus (strain ATCC 28846 / CBS 209.66 / NRRL 28638) TaxID=796925 RepID=A0A137NUF0_CONC2|nr:voltage-dependent potassium channel, beta subunit [Conidiobolus coronatus NRRL 28638]|eukprot:KXN66301.1 voltage-dependent potassium channel, beta subunit [Conidiobolus coronatus NRRL 28638]